MAEGDERRGGPEEGPEDLFEDLDRFFASIDETDWPAGSGSSESVTEASADEPVDPETPAAATGAPDEPVADEPAEEPPAYEAPGERATDEPPEAAPPYEPAEEPAATPAEEPPTREMSPADWGRLRDVLGDGDEDEEEDGSFLFGEAGSEPPPEETLFGYASPDEPALQEEGGPSEGRETEPGRLDMGEEPEGTEPGELTLDDLKKAPPQYRDLPGPAEGPSEGGAPASPPPTYDPVRYEAYEAEPTTHERPGAVPDLETGSPSLADVEAAAEQLAGQFEGAPGGVDDDLLTEPAAPPRTTRTVKVGEPESLLGPAWEDPSSHTVSHEPPGARLVGGRNLPAAVLTGAALVVLALVFVLISKALFALLAGAVILLGQAELYAAMHRRDVQPATALGLVVGGFTLAAAYLKGEPAMLFMLGIGVLASFLWYMAATPKARTNVIANIGATLFGVVYVPFLAGYVLVILAIPGAGRSLMLAILGLTFLYDIAAFGFGNLWGSRPLAPSISPKKSWEGLLGATVMTFAFAITIVPSIDAMTVVRSIGLALVVVVFAPLGDLAESMIKRDLGLKDMGAILPGHGGILDRIDSALLVAPAAFYFLRLIF